MELAGFEASAVADRVAVLEAGRLSQVATLTELRARPATAFVQAFCPYACVYYAS